MVDLPRLCQEDDLDGAVHNGQRGVDWRGGAAG